MKLATLKSIDSRDGELLVVSRDNTRAVKATDIAPHLRGALENWSVTHGPLQELSARLNREQLPNAFAVQLENLHSPMPRTFQWADGSAFIHHIKLVRMARGAPLPETLETVPLMYQGGGDDFLPPLADIPQLDFSHGTDFEGEVGVILLDTPMGVSSTEALNHIALFVLINDVSLRGLIPEELAQGFGFFQSKPSSAFGPFAITADELGENLREGRIHLPLRVGLNGEAFGSANAGAMHFHFGQLIAHAARTRNLKAGTIIGSGTVSNDSPISGSSCIVERRMIEKITEGTMKTPFMKVGDVVKMEMIDQEGRDLFGKIHQRVIQA